MLVVLYNRELIFCGVAYYVAFGPHGPRAPTSQPGDNLKIFLATMGLVGVATVLTLIVHKSGGFYLRVFPTRHPYLTIYVSFIAPPPPKTLTKEWEEATNVRAREMNINPISGMCRFSVSSMHIYPTRVI
jgi:cytochrome c oxidase subunit 4